MTSQLFSGCLALLLLATSGAAAASATERFGCGGPKNGARPAEPGVPELREAIAEDLRDADFEAVIEAAKAWRAADCRLPDGSSQVGFWLSGFTRFFESRQVWEASLEMIRQLNRSHPGHPLARLAEARYWSDYANEARGFGLADTVTPDGWRLFRDRLGRSESILVEAAASASTWPHWYVQMIRVQALSGRPAAERMKTFNDGIQRFPQQLSIYSEMSYYLEPRWGGDWRLVDEVIATATQKAPAEDADMVYATLYRSRGDLLPRDRDFFAETKASWPRMKRGFDRLLQRHPASTVLGNSVLAYACMAGDKGTYLSHRQTYTTFDRRGWTRNSFRDTCDERFGYRK